MEESVPDPDHILGEGKSPDKEKVGEMIDRSHQTHEGWEREKNQRITEGRMTIHQTETEKKEDRAGNQTLFQGAAEK